jgi:hypothetical protein
LTSVQIGRYRMRKTGPRDLGLVRVWQDQGGKDNDPEFFCVDNGAAECTAFEDRTGIVLFYLRMELMPATRRMWMNMLFPQNANRTQRMRIADAMARGFEWICTGCAGAGIDQVYFASCDPGLVDFAKERLGFQDAPEGFVHVIHRLDGETSYSAPQKSGATVVQEIGDGHVRKQ